MEKSELKNINSLIIKIGSGDEYALEQLFKSVGGRMLSVAIGITKDRQLAEDAVQESFMKIVRYSSSFKRHDNGYGWICTIVRNESLTIIKKFKPLDSNIDDLFNLSDFSAADKLQQKLEVETAVKKLPMDEQYLIWLRYVCDMTIRDIAAYLSQPKSTVMNKLQKACESLKKLLE